MAAKQNFLIVARLPGELAVLKRGVYFSAATEVHEVLAKDLLSIQTRKYVGGIVGPSVCREDREICKALIGGSA